jgi:hypothetical protein
VPTGAQSRRSLSILVGAFRYKHTQHPNGSHTDVSTVEDNLMKFTQHFESTVLVLDSKTNSVTATDPLLDTTSWPMAAISGDTLYTLGGEGGQCLFHPAMFLRGDIEDLR